jgi:hypothetical protein
MLAHVDSFELRVAIKLGAMATSASIFTITIHMLTYSIFLDTPCL